jgi:hypothetical protein
MDGVQMWAKRKAFRGIVDLCLSTDDPHPEPHVSMGQPSAEVRSFSLLENVDLRGE